MTILMLPLYYRFVSPVHTSDGTLSNAVPFFVSAIETVWSIPRIFFIRFGYIRSISLFSLFTLPHTPQIRWSHYSPSHLSGLG